MTLAIPSIDLSGKTALVTGAAKGLGLAICRQLVECGASVAIVDLAAKEASAAAATFSGKVIALEADVANESDCDRVVAATVAEFGDLDILINNAGIGEPITGTLKQTMDDWQRVIDVNLRGSFQMARACARHMASHRGGAIVNLASVAGLLAQRASNAYGVSKAGIVMLTQTLALDFAGKNIRVNAIAPGVISTDLSNSLMDLLPGGEASMRARIPMGQFGSPVDIAHAAAFLVSDWASYITGVTLPVDGGWCAHGGAGNAS